MHAEEIEEVIVPVQYKEEITLESMPIVYPHRIISYLFNVVGLEMRDSDVVAFWRHAKEFGQGWAKFSAATEHHIPLGVYGDGAQLITQYKKEKLIGLFLNLILYRPRSTRCSRYLLFACDEERLVKNRTMNAVFRRLLWSFEALYTGLNPSAPPPGACLSPADLQRAGTRITAEGRVFAVVELRGDWAWMKQIFRFPRCGWQAKMVSGLLNFVY